MPRPENMAAFLHSYLGCWSAGLRAARSPGVTTPHFVTSNKLGDKFQPPRPSHSPDYDSLMARVSGDFGIKSAIVRAAKQDPEYKGVDTLVVPLYIPKGAVPIRLERIPRSGGDQEKSQSSGTVRVLSRRTRLPPVTSKRRGGPRRTLHPTPPPSYLRGWGRRILPKADARIGLQSDSEASESQALESDLPELIRSKKNQNSRLLHILKTTTAENRGHTESTVNKASLSTTTETVPTLRLRRGSTSKPPFLTDDFLSSSSINGVENTSQTPTTDILLSNQTIRIPIFNLKSISGSPNFQGSSNKSRNTSISSENTNYKSEVSKPQRRPLLPPKPVKESLGHSLRTIRTSTPDSSSSVTSSDTHNNDANLPDQKESLLPSISSVVNSAPAFPLLSAISSTIAPSLSTTRRIDFNNKSTVGASTLETSVTTSTTTSPTTTSPTTTSPTTTSPTTTSPTTTSPTTTSPTTTSPTTTSPTTTSPTTTSPTTTSLTSSIPVVSFPHIIETSTSNKDLNITVSPTPPEVRRIHDFFRMAIGRNRQTDKNSSRTTEAPFRYISSKFHARTTARPVPSTSGSRVKFESPQNSSMSSPTITTPVPAAKTPADIVLAGFSDVMRATNAGTKDRFREITSNLDTLNKQLAERGILIIHAEIEAIQESFDDKNNFEKESEQVQSLADTADFSPTVFTPSDKLEYDIVLKNDDEFRENKNNLRPSSHDLEHQTPNNFLNEVSTVKLMKSSIESTQKPESFSDANIVTEELINDSHNVDPFSLRTEAFIDATDFKINSVEIVSTIRPTEREDDELKAEISSQAVTPQSIPPRMHAMPIPVIDSDGTNEVPTNAPSVERSPSNLEDMDEKLTIDTSTHLMPMLSKIRKSDIIRANDTAEARETVKMYEELEKEQIFLVEELLLEENAEGAANSASNDIAEPVQSEGGSSVYLVGMVGIFPLAGVAAYIVRRFLRGDSHKKALPESEERPDGFTPPTHHHPRAHSLLPPVPEMKLTTPLSSSLTSAMNSDANSNHNLLNHQPSPTPWEFNRSKLKLVSILGEGNFGVVWKAEARGFCDYAAGGVLVAVKRVKDGASAKEKQDLLRELSVMQLLGPHPNVVSLLGCCTQTEPHLVIMEYVMFGKLLTFLRDHRTRHNYFNFSSDTAALTSRDLTRFACQVATGCDYLQSRGIIHRDLAARNILVDHNKVCKIADFGMARSIQDIGSDIYEQKSKGALPIRWMAPESLYMNIFTHKSDVWSFGILCWEIVTLGATPYPGLTAREVMRQVTEGYRLERPDHCKPELYKLLATCWQQDLNKRPTFHNLKMELSTLLEHQTGYIDLENFPEEDYFSMHQNNDEKL
ncbi:Serine-threonine/tyrosine-protein kinase catalytic domain [Trinorchestia longiramus]|nr:Serine-threonine/tyrosine-protein kinase catalytic domain [Trinorchestia longiramus]